VDAGSAKRDVIAGQISARERSDCVFRGRATQNGAVIVFVLELPHIALQRTELHDTRPSS
jgi:hypothetical protein